MKKQKQVVKKSGIYRQGDVLVIPTGKIPKNSVKTKKVTLALGEVTGHHHTIHNGAFGYGESDTALVDFLEIESDTATLTHQEHTAIEIPKGNYECVRQTEYTPEALRNVAD